MKHHKKCFLKWNINLSQKNYAERETCFCVIPEKRKGEIAQAARKRKKNQTNAHGSKNSNKNPFTIHHIYADLSSERQDKMCYLKNQSVPLINSHIC